jgi:NADH-quinone oxidoreductase subunit M
MSEFGGLARVTPVLAVFFFVALLSSIGLPGTNGFIGEFLVLAGTWNSKYPSGPWFAAAGALGVILGAVYMLWMYQRVFLGPLRRAENHGLPDLTGREWAVLLPLAVLIPLIGIMPQPLLDRIEPAAYRLVARMERVLPPTTGGETVPIRQILQAPGGPSRPGPRQTFPPELIRSLRPDVPPQRAP